jgi:methyl-accepting chemotaxis protein
MSGIQEFAMFRIRWFLFIIIQLGFLWGFTSTLSAESVNAVQSLSEYTYLRSSWRYIYDDNPAYSETAFNDSAWQSVNFPAAVFPFHMEKSRYCWLRKEFTVSKVLEGETMGLFIGKLPDASEVYLNGSIIATSGSMPPQPVYSAPNIPRETVIPGKLINYGGKNILAIRVYQMRNSGAFSDIFISSHNATMQRNLVDFMLNSVVSMIASILSIFVSIYFFLLFFRERYNRYNLYIAIGFPVLAVYFSSIYIEFVPVDYLFLLKLQFIGLYIGLLFFAFYFQSFYQINKRGPLRIIMAIATLAASYLLYTAKDQVSFEFMNNNILYLAVVVPMLFYILIVSFLAVRKGNKYARILTIGALLIILAGVYDIIHGILAIQPRFWMTAWGMIAFVCSIFFTAANHTVDTNKDSRNNSEKLQKQTETLKKVLENIREIGEKVSESGKTLDTGISDATAAIQQMVSTNRIIIDNVQNQVNTIEGNSGTIVQIMDSFNKVADEVNKQARFVEESSTVMKEIVDSITSVYQITDKARNIAQNLSSVAEDGKKLVKESSVAIHEIENYSENVKNIVDEIKEISEKTNILAMNAAIQSAHAGEYGRGFAVVANEVRKLSESSDESTLEINKHIDEMLSKINNGVELFDKLKKALDNIMGGTKETTNLIEDITVVSQKQHSETHQIMEAMNSLVNATESLKKQTVKQKDESEKIRESFEELRSVASRIEKSTVEQTSGGQEIVNMIDKIKHISSDNQEILNKLDELINISEVSKAQESLKGPIQQI